jgi:hypothetical protein
MLGVYVMKPLVACKVQGIGGRTWVEDANIRVEVFFDVLPLNMLVKGSFILRSRNPNLQRT